MMSHAALVIYVTQMVKALQVTVPDCLILRGCSK